MEKVSAMAETKEIRDLLRLLLLTPDGKKAEAMCDSVIMLAADDEKGRGGGSFEIRKGHIPALAALVPGEVLGRTKNEVVLRAETDGGFARVDGDSVTILTGKFEIIE